jgi:hypothetical protein
LPRVFEKSTKMASIANEQLEDRRTELRHTKHYPVAFPYLYRSCTRDIRKISTFSNFQMFGWIKSKLYTSLIRGFSLHIMLYYNILYFLFFPHYDVILCIKNCIIIIIYN